MDIAFLVGITALWGVMVGLVAGFKKLEQHTGVRS